QWMSLMEQASAWEPGTEGAGGLGPQMEAIGVSGRRPQVVEAVLSEIVNYKPHEEFLRILFSLLPRQARAWEEDADYLVEIMVFYNRFAGLMRDHNANAEVRQGVLDFMRMLLRRASRGQAKDLN